MKLGKESSKILAWVLSFAMILGGVAGIVTPAVVKADVTARTMNFGVSVINNPKLAVEGGAWTGDYVYLGRYDVEGDGNMKPIPYRVLDRATTEFGGDNTVLLDCDGGLDRFKFHRVVQGGNIWPESDIKHWLNSEKDESGNSYDYSDTGFLTTSFTDLEQDAIAYSTKENESAEDGAGISILLHTPLAGTKIFLMMQRN